MRFIRALFFVAHQSPHTSPDYALVLNDNDPVLLRGVTSIAFSAGQRFRFFENNELDSRSFQVRVVEYWYEISTPEGREILTFHWSPEADPVRQVTFPHLHIGSVNIAKTAPLLPKTFSNFHIPTGRVSLQPVIRFLIEELQVRPRRLDWSSILHQE